MASIQDRIMVVTDLLLGAVYADDKLEGQEEVAVRKLLGELMAGKPLPADVDKRIKTFPAGSFDLDKTAKDFVKDPPIKKRKLLELVAAVRDADDEIDLQEDEYMQKLAKALGMKKEEYADLVLDYDVEDLKASFEEIRKVSAPPPPPKK
jgi:uncharacterized tellurite resistance protein B-like protein